MNHSSSFTRFAAVCCLLTAITTLAIHLFFPEPPADFEKRVLLFKDNIYLLNRWVIIVHCILVIISMWGFALIQLKEAPGYAGLGFLFFVVFGIAEITRQFFVFYYLNGLKEQYYQATDPAARELLKNTLSNAGLLAAPLFGLFTLSFGLGNLFYGISLRKATGLSGALGILLIIWSLLSFVTLGNDFWKSATIDRFTELLHFTFQPLIRLLLGLWLWKKADKAKQLLNTQPVTKSRYVKTDHRLS